MTGRRVFRTRAKPRIYERDAEMVVIHVLGDGSFFALDADAPETIPRHFPWWWALMVLGGCEG